MSKVTIAERIFNVVRDTPGLSEENIHEILSVDITYKTSSGKSLIYRMLRVKFLRKDKNGKFFTHIDAYKPLPAYKPKKKKSPVDAVSVKLNQASYPASDKYWAAAAMAQELAMNAYRHLPLQVQPEPKPVTGGFLGNLGRRISAYFK